MGQCHWKVRVIIEEAMLEVAFLFENPDVKSEVNRILKTLAEQDDPRIPSKDSYLDIMEIQDDAPGWCRVKVPRYGIRIVFRLIVIRDKRFLLIENDKPLPEYQEGDKCFIEVMQAGYRKDVYGATLRRRYWKYTSEEDD